MTKKEAKQSFGKMVSSDVRLKKINHFSMEQSLNTWEAVDEPIEGLMTGTRTYKDGTCGYPFYRETYIIKKCHEVALIVTDWRKNPVPVPLESCQLVKHTLNERL